MNKEDIESIKIDLKASIELNFVDNYDMIKSRIDNLNSGLNKLSEKVVRRLNDYTYDEYCVTMLASFNEGYDDLSQDVFDGLDITDNDKYKIANTANIYLANNNGISNPEDLKKLIDLELARLKSLKFEIFFNDVTTKIWKIFIKNMLLLRINHDELEKLNISFDDDFDAILNQLLKD